MACFSLGFALATWWEAMSPLSAHAQRPLHSNAGPLSFQYDEQGLVQAVGTYNPVSIAFEVKEDFVLYQEGVYTR